MDYTWKPIIVEGVNHSGTRALVQILSVLGSDGGDCDNPYKENKFFLELHESLVTKTSGKSWAETIFSLPFLTNYKDDLRYRDYIHQLLKDNLRKHFPACNESPWHWKCPTSALFERTWVDIFPEAYYIHIVRDPLECAESLLRRNQIRSMKEGLEFCSRMNEKITEIPKKNYLRVRYEDLADELYKIRDFVPVDFETSRIELAKSIIVKEERKYWYPQKSLRQNLYNLRARLLFHLASRSYNS